MISRLILKRDAIFTLFFFVGLCLSSSLAMANENKPLAADKKSQGQSTSIEKTETMPGVAEVESPDSEGAAVKAKKKFPWLLVGAGVIVVGVLVYFLLIKKKEQTLTVNLGVGATGTPAVSAKYKKGMVVSYNYAPQAGFSSLLVKLDGVAVAASGSVTMDKDHTLDVSATQQYTLTVNLGFGTTGMPAVTTSYNKDQVVNYSYTAQAGYISLKVMLDGHPVAANGMVNMDKDHTLDISAIKHPILTVNLGTGTTGKPAVTTSYNKDQVVNYSYTAQAGYFSLQVKLDGVEVLASGIITMDSNHTLDVSVSSYKNGVLTFKGVRYELASIPAGEFQMGSNSAEASSDEKPVHTVRISKKFWLGKTEVTQGLWQAVMGSNPSNFDGDDNYPVETVSWGDCQSFITKLNQMFGSNYFRLPTEAEWEYACRAGTTGDRYGNIDAIAWYDSNSGNTPHPVGQKQANAWGLYDTLGNVWEWCQDWYGGYSAGYQTDPSGPPSGSDRVKRGGCYYDGAPYVRSAVRDRFFPGGNDIDLGFRLAAVSAGN